MKRTVTRLGLVVAIAAAIVGIGAGPAPAQAAVIDCSRVFDGLQGRIVFTPSGNLLGNCFEHIEGGAAPTGGSATLIDCDERLGEGAIGIQVVTPAGNLYTNCHVRITPAA